MTVDLYDRDTFTKVRVNNVASIKAGLDRVGPTGRRGKAWIFTFTPGSPEARGNGPEIAIRQGRFEIEAIQQT